MKSINIPFSAEWEIKMIAGKKTATSRNKRYGYPGDCFEAFGRQFILTEVYLLTLGSVAYNHYLEEGCNSNFEFQKVWKKLHPRKGFCSDHKVYFHKFKLQSDIAQFHVHELTDNGYCRICGCDPTPLSIEKVQA